MKIANISFQILTFYPSREAVRLKWMCLSSIQVVYIASSSNFEEVYLCALFYKTYQTYQNFTCCRFLELFDVNCESVNRVEIPDFYEMEDKEKQQRLKNMSISDDM